MRKRVALITGVTGQDGSYLAEFLLERGYEVHGVKRRSSSLNTERVDHLFEDPSVGGTSFFLHYGDVTDSSNILALISKLKPDEVYNLAAQSHVAVSFEQPEYTANADALGCLRILEALRISGHYRHSKFYQASTSELFGNADVAVQSETTPFRPRSPYGVAKLYAYWLTRVYREAYGMWACNGVLFNHESPRRGETFVSRKITRALAGILHGGSDPIELGNLDARRDWGHARDYVEAQWLMLQQSEPTDLVIATGSDRSVRDFANAAFLETGLELEWSGAAESETATIAKSHQASMKRLAAECGFDAEATRRLLQRGAELVGACVIKVNRRYFRPAEVDILKGDASLARDTLGWEPRISFVELVREMVVSDLSSLQRVR